MNLTIQHTHFFIVGGELATQQVDVLIHPTNNYLWFSAGASEELKRRGGDEMENQALALGPIPVGEAVLTTAGRLKSRFMIHAAAWGQDMMTSDVLIRRTLNASLELIRERKLTSMAIAPALFVKGSLPLIRVVDVVFLTVVEHCLKETSLDKVLFLANDPAEKEVLERMFRSARAADPPKNEDNL